MIKAIIQNGFVVPRAPLPADWREGTEVEVEKAFEQGATENGMYPTDAWMNEVEAIAAEGNPADDARLEAGIQETRRREKELAQRRLESAP